VNRHSAFFLIASWLFGSGASFAGGDLWPNLSNRVGPYGGIATVEDVKAAAAAGFNLTVQARVDRTVLAAMRDLGINRIDIQLWGLIYAQCKIEFEREAAAAIERRCNLSSETAQLLLRDAAAYLEQVKNDSGIVAYWILDDYPSGNIASVLAELHGLVTKKNRETGMNKPTICGIGGSLDHRTVSRPKVLPDHGYIELSLQNITPAACDVIAPYFYGAATENNPDWIDWTMGNLMSWFLGKLRDQGFVQPALLPVVQAFYSGKRGGTTYYVQPRPEDIAAQAKAYCRSGAIALQFFTWRADDAERSYVNDADIREGVRRAILACHEQLDIRVTAQDTH
jgi:hypothetical protein